MSLDRPSLFRCLDRLDFGQGSWAVAGSGPMLAHGIVAAIGDIDIVADNRAWEHALDQTASTAVDGLSGDRIISLMVAGAVVEVFDEWLGSPALGVIERADVVAGHRFMALDEVIDFKRHLDRPKDRVHVAMVEQYLAGEQPPTMD